MDQQLEVRVAEFSAMAELDGSVVYEGKVFEAGVYPDKDFAIDEAELTVKAAAFEGVDLDLEHSSFKDVLGNKLGRLESIWRQGADAIGRLRVPRWLHELAGGRLQTSLSFDRDKNIVGCALTLSPRISDAEVFAAFSRFGNNPSLVSATTSGVGPSPITNQMGFERKPSFPRSVFPSPPAPSPITNQMGEGVLTIKEIEHMTTSFKDRLKVLFGAAPEATQAAGIDPLELDRVEFADSHQRLDPAIQAQLAEFKATNDRLIAGQVGVAAAMFADEIVRSAKAVPAQREHLISLYKTAAITDGHGVVKFSESGQIEEGVNLKALRDLFKDAQPHSLFTTQIANADPNEGAQTPDPAMVEKLRAATSLGQQTMKETK